MSDVVEFFNIIFNYGRINMKVNICKTLIAMSVIALFQQSALAENIVIERETNDKVTTTDPAGGTITINAPIIVSNTDPSGSQRAIEIISSGDWMINNNSLIQSSAFLPTAIFVDVLNDISIVNDGNIFSISDIDSTGLSYAISVANTQKFNIENNTGSTISATGGLGGSAIVADSINLQNDGDIIGAGGSNISPGMGVNGIYLRPEGSNPSGDSLIVNRGLISGDSKGILQASGGQVAIINESSGRIINTADAESNFSAGIYLQAMTAGSATTINNNVGGLIQGSNGVYLYPRSYSEQGAYMSLEINNSGLIEGRIGDGIISLGGNITNTVTGQIKGANFGIDIYSSGADITNQGLISGKGGTAIRFEQSGNYNNSLILDTGSILDGNVLGSEGTGTDSLILKGSGTEEGYRFQNFEILTVDGNQWELSSPASFSQSSMIKNGVLILNSSLTTPTLDIQQQGILTGTATINGNVANSGTMSPSQSGGFSTLTINGDYTGNNGFLILNTRLGDDSSLSDRLVVNGDISGNTLLVIKNDGGNGALTNNGIMLVDNANGTSTDDAFSLSSASTGYRTSTETLSAGGYDYHLAKGGNNGQQQSWYLVSDITQPIPDPTPEPANSTQVSPESGSWLGNKYAAQTMFIQTLHDRAGEPLYNNSNTNFWIRTEGSRLRNADTANGFISIDTNKVATQFGVGLWNLQQASQSLQAGLMFGYGNAHTTSTSNLINSKTGQNVAVSAKGKVDGYSAGAYGTWYQDSESRLGSYVDVWGLYGWYQNELNSEIGSADYNSKVLNLSLETGYAIKPFSSSDFIMEPQAQIIYTNYQADDATLAGTRYRSQDDNLVTTRLGARWYVTGKQYQPFIETNWLYNSNDNAVIVGTQTFSSDSVKSIFELKVGLNGQITPNVQLYGNISEQLSASNADFSQFGGQVGIKYQF